MKTFCILLSLLVNSLAIAYEAMNIPKHPENEMFFLTQDSSLIAVDLQPEPQYFGDLNKPRSDAERIVKVPTSILSVFGLYPGMTIQSINIRDGGKKDTYKLGKEFFALLRLKNDHYSDESSKDVPMWNKFNVLLSDNPKVHKHILGLVAEKERNGVSWVTGFAYAGNKITLKEGDLEQTKLQETPKNHPFMKGSVKNERVGSTLINGVEAFFVIDQKAKVPVSGFVKAKQSFYFIFNSTYAADAKIVTDDGRFILLGKWIDGAKSFFYDDTTPPQIDCFNLMIFEKDKISKVEFECKGR